MIQRKFNKQKTNKNSFFQSNHLAVAMKQTNEIGGEFVEPEAFYTVYKNQFGLFFLTIFMA